MKTLVFLATMMMPGVLGDNLTVMGPTTVYEFTQRVGQKAVYWGDAFTDPNDPYGIRIEIDGPELAGIVVDPNTGTPIESLNGATASDPNSHLLWGFTAKPIRVGVYDIRIKAIEHQIKSDPVFFTERIVRLKVIKAQTPPTIRILITIDAKVEITFTGN